MPTRLIDASTAGSEDSSIAYVNTNRRIEGYRVFKVVISSAATVLIQGRFNTDDAWHTINTYTSTGSDSIAGFPQMRTSMSGNNGTVSAWIDV